MAVLFAALNTAPEYGIPHPGPVATYPYPFDPLDTNGPTKKSLATHQSSTGAGGPPLLAVLLPVFLGSFFLLAGFYGLMRWVGRTDKSQDGSTEKGQKADEGTFLVQRNKDQGTRRARQHPPLHAGCPREYHLPRRSTLVEAFDLPKPPPAYHP